jgi:hypothetical protein
VHRANFYFDATLREALARTRTLSALHTILRESAPTQLSADLWVRSLNDGTLHLGASNGAVAAKVKQMLPSLIQRFSRHGFELKAIRVSVDRKPRRRIERQSDKPQVDRNARRHLAKLVAALGDSPLKRAVQKLITSQSKNGNEPVESEE